MSYTRVNWQNGVSGGTPISAENLNKMDKGIDDLFNAIFPIGQIVIKGDNADYSNWLGYIWERTAVGKVLVGYDSNDTDFDTIGETGGEKTHTLTVSEMPSHGHGFKAIKDIINTDSDNNGGGAKANNAQGNNTGYQSNYTTDAIQNTGGGQAHNNLPPYQVVAYWKRIS